MIELQLWRGREIVAGMRVLRFDAFTIDPSRPAVLRDGFELELRSQSFAVLNHLVERANRLVSKQELFDAIWRGAARTDDSLVQCITEIRQALGDADHRIIKTVRGRGYKFVAEVSEAPAAPEATPQANERLPHGRSPPVGAPQAHRRGPLIAAGLLISVLAGSGWLLWSIARQPPAMLTMMAMPSIAILPVKPLGDDSDNGVAVLADEIVTGLWRAPRGFKPDIRPTNGGKDATGDARAIGRELGVRYLVRSSVRREHDLMHINVQLIEGESARQEWVGSFEYRPGQPGAQNRIAARIGRTLAAELLRAEVRRPLPGKAEAAHFTMLGRWLMNNERDAKTNGEAIALFEKAISTDPQYSLALVNYARATADHILNGWAPKKEHAERIAKAEAAIKLAIKLEPDSAGAYLSHGGLLRARGDYKQAIAAFTKALLHDPNFANAHAELGRTKIDVGLAHDTAAHVKEAIALSPTDFAVYIWCYWAGLAALHLGEHEAALDWLLDAQQANRAYDNSLRLMAIAYDYAGNETKARTKMDEFLKLRPRFTLSGWKENNASQHQLVAEQRARMADTMRRLGVPEDKLKSASTP